MTVTGGVEKGPLSHLPAGCLQFETIQLGVADMTTVSDLGAEGFLAWCYQAFATISVALGLLFYLFPRRFSRRVDVPGRKFEGIGLIIIGILMAGISLPLLMIPYLEGVNVLKTGNDTAIEGVLGDLKSDRARPTEQKILEALEALK
jgi:hypothetical protein